MVYNACLRGIGSGTLGCLMLECLSVDYDERVEVSLTVRTCPHMTTTAVEPYNAVLRTHSLLEHTDVTTMYDYESVSDILRLSKGSNEFPDNTHSLSQVKVRAQGNGTTIRVSDPALMERWRKSPRDQSAFLGILSGGRSSKRTRMQAPLLLHT